MTTTSIGQLDWDEIVEARNKLIKSEVALSVAQKGHKAAKDLVDVLQQKLNNLIDDHCEPNLFNSAAKPAAPKPEDAWRSVGIEDLNIISDATKQKLRENDPPLDTLGAIADWTASKKLTDVAGIGEKTAEQIEDAITDWWERHPDYYSQSGDDSSANEGGDDDGKQDDTEDVDGEATEELRAAGV